MHPPPQEVSGPRPSTSAAVVLGLVALGHLAPRASVSPPEIRCVSLLAQHRCYQRNSFSWRTKGEKLACSPGQCPWPTQSRTQGRAAAQSLLGPGCVLTEPPCAVGCLFVHWEPQVCWSKGLGDQARRRSAWEVSREELHRGSWEATLSGSAEQMRRGS